MGFINTDGCLSDKFCERPASGDKSGLFLQQAGVAGDALPLSKVKHPRVREASEVVIRFALVGTLGVIDTRDHGGCPQRNSSSRPGC